MKMPTPTEAAARRCSAGWVAAAATSEGLVHTSDAVATRAKAIAEVGGAGLPEGELSARAADAIAAFLSTDPRPLDFPLDLRAVPAFTASVLRAVARIPVGETRTYGDIAREVGRPRAARAVGQVLASNPLAPVVPCHRVVGAVGLGGFAGGVEAKARLLARERARIADG